MSTLTYNETNKLSVDILTLCSAGALALVVHAIFFSLLYFSFNWHVKTPPNMVVEMWDSLPNPVTQIIPVTPPPIPVFQKAETISMPKMAEPVAMTKAEIVFKDKKKKKIEPVKKMETSVSKKTSIPDEKFRQKIDEDKKIALAQADHDRKAKQEDLEKLIADVDHSALEEERIQQRKAKMRSELEEAANSEKTKYKELIQAKISRNIIMPPDVPDSAEAKFMVIVLPGGSVMDGGVKLLKSSGNNAYDNAAERAIYKAQPLPIPQDADLAREFRELRLSVKP